MNESILDAIVLTTATEIAEDTGRQNVDVLREWRDNPVALNRVGHLLVLRYRQQTRQCSCATDHGH